MTYFTTFIKKIEKIEQRIGNHIRRSLLGDLLSDLNCFSSSPKQRGEDYFDWVNLNLADFVDEFVQENLLADAHFIKRLNKIFKTNRFGFFLKRWLIEYFMKLFGVFNTFTEHRFEPGRKLVLEDNPLNRFAAKKYFSKFYNIPKIKWKKQANLVQHLLGIFLFNLSVLYFSLNRGLRLSTKKKKYKVMREAMWGLYDFNGLYFHDDFLVDGDKIKTEDLLLFSRGVPTQSWRFKAYHDAIKSPYAHFNLQFLRIGLKSFFLRVIPKYIFLCNQALLGAINSAHYSLFLSILLYFIVRALPYEKVFSNFTIISELGHIYSSSSSATEAIVCQSHGTRYYLMHWSDLSIPNLKHTTSFLCCDKFLLWGRAHFKGGEGDDSIISSIGYVFKRFIEKVKSNRAEILSKMGIHNRGKVVAFFDESFGGEIKIKAEYFMNFWKTALRFALKHEKESVIIKSKSLDRCEKLSKNMKEEFSMMKSELTQLPNVTIVDSVEKPQWSFIEVIGVSDVVITQCVCSSSTIAIICGIEGLYLDEAGYDHPLREQFKDKIVFDDPEKLLAAVDRIIEGTENPLKNIPKTVLRDYDAYDDSRGIDRCRTILSKGD